jgi:hypothetical protein
MLQVCAILPLDYVKLEVRAVDWHKLKWPMVAISFLVGLGLLVSAHYLWQRTAVEKPLVERLRQDPDVSSVTLRHENGRLAVEVLLKAVPRLATTTERIGSLVRQAYPRVARITYKDQSNTALEALYYDMHFALHQAARNGDYREMADWVHALAHNGNLTDYRVEVGSTAIYLQLHAEDAYLYRIIPLAGAKP